MSAASTVHGAARTAPKRAPAARRRARGVRWDRVGRLALLFVLLALLYLYASAGIRMLSTWQQSRHDNAVVAGLEREHTRLQRQHEALSGPGSVEAQARQLGMIRRGEQGYVVTGLPNN